VRREGEWGNGGLDSGSSERSGSMRRCHLCGGTNTCCRRGFEPEQAEKDKVKEEEEEEEEDLTLVFQVICGPSEFRAPPPSEWPAGPWGRCRFGDRGTDEGCAYFYFFKPNKSKQTGNLSAAAGNRYTGRTSNNNKNTYNESEMCLTSSSVAGWKINGPRVKSPLNLKGLCIVCKEVMVKSVLMLFCSSPVAFVV